MFGLKSIFLNPICCTKVPFARSFLDNQLRLSCSLVNSKKFSYSNNTRHLLSLPAGNVRFAATFAGNPVYRYIKNKINSLRLLERRKDALLGMYLYQSLEHVKFDEFYTHLKLPDTYRSWFIVAELHVWMLLVRLQQEGVDARIVRDCIVESFYEDSERRSTILAPMDGSRRKGQLREFYEDFRPALLFYDEGLITEDRVFANALWFHFFAKECDDPRCFEILIRYIRHQVNFLCHLNSKDIMNYQRSHIIWQPLEPHVKVVQSLDMT